jgi:signal-transduction protein with cAMP-binding, CBS, and nucleotidyltransferase domain
VLELAVSNDLVVRGCARLTARRLGLELDRLIPDAPPEHFVMEHFADERVIEKVFVLEGAEIFAQCEIDDLAALAAIARERVFRGGEAVYEEGDPGETLYVVLEGKVRFEKGGVEVTTAGVREAFGEASLLDGAPRPVRAVALAPELRVLAIDRQDFLELVSDRPELLKGVMAAVIRHLRAVLESQATERLGPSGPGAVVAPVPRKAG